MIVTAWYFTDEMHTLIGPYTTEADAVRANELHDAWTGRPLTAEEETEADAIDARAAKLTAWIRMGREEG